MLYSTLLAAFSATLVAAQSSNSTSGLTLPSGVSQCCSVNANSVPADEKTAWCDAQENTCPEICGGQGQIATGGNECDTSTLQFTCKCRNGTEPNMSEYQQSVPGQMCRFWYIGCINATIGANGEGNSALQFSCNSIRDAECGNKTTKDAETSSTSSRTSRPATSATGSGSSGTTATSSAGSASSSTPGAAVRIAQDFGAPVLAGGMMALFGMAL